MPSPPSPPSPGPYSLGSSLCQPPPLPKAAPHVRFSSHEIPPTLAGAIPANDMPTDSTAPVSPVTSHRVVPLLGVCRLPQDDQARMFTDICKFYKDYEGSCRDAATFVTSYKPVMSNALLHAALQVRRRPPPPFAAAPLSSAPPLYVQCSALGGRPSLGRVQPWEGGKEGPGGTQVHRTLEQGKTGDHAYTPCCSV